MHHLGQLYPPPKPADSASADLSQPINGAMLSGALQHYLMVTANATALDTLAPSKAAGSCLASCPVCSPLGNSNDSECEQWSGLHVGCSLLGWLGMASECAHVFVCLQVSHTHQLLAWML